MDAQHYILYSFTSYRVLTFKPHTHTYINGMTLTFVTKYTVYRHEKGYGTSPPRGIKKMMSHHFVRLYTVNETNCEHWFCIVFVLFYIVFFYFTVHCTTGTTGRRVVPTVSMVEVDRTLGQSPSSPLLLRPWRWTLWRSPLWASPMRQGRRLVTLRRVGPPGHPLAYVAVLGYPQPGHL